MPKAVSKRWLRFHLSTALATMFFASGLIWLNTRTTLTLGDAAPAIHAVFNGKIDVLANNTPAQEVFSSCLENTSVEIIFDGEFKDSVTLSLTNVKPSEALNLLRKRADWLGARWMKMQFLWASRETFSEFAPLWRTLSTRRCVKA